MVMKEATNHVKAEKAIRGPERRRRQKERGNKKDGQHLGKGKERRRRKIGR